MKIIIPAIAVVIIAVGLCIPSAHPVAAAPSATPEVTITSVSALNLATNCWTVTLSSGDVLQVELRALDGAGAPHTGALSHFIDQGWLPILGYYGLATFEQNNAQYYAHH